MTSVSKRSVGFTSSTVYRRREPHAFAYLSERATFWIAVFSVFAFVTGNMIGQNGWAVFWKSVMGEGSESTIVFTGTVPPIRQIPNVVEWQKLGGSVRTHTFRQVPKDLLIPLPRYVHHGNDTAADPALRSVYFTENLGTYTTGRGEGSHTGVDISVPEGTPVVSIANGIVFRVDSDPTGFGTYIVVKHPNVPDVEKKGEMGAVYTVYAHLSEAQVQEGMVVLKGEQIGLSGSTGFASAPHLHFQAEHPSAPYHPYWSFTSAEQRQAKMTFVQAVDTGLGRAGALQYTLDPMLLVQSYQGYVPPVVLTRSGSSSSAQSRLTVADRRAARLAKLGTAGSTGLTAGSSVIKTLIAYTDSAPVIPIPVPPSSASSSPKAVVGVGTVASIRITHDGTFSRDRGWKKVTLTLLDAQGNLVRIPQENRKIALTTAFGRAEFRRPNLTLADFRNGVYETEALPLADQTLVMLVKPYDDKSERPMKFVR